MGGVVDFKILVIQAQNNLSDDRTKFLINDRLSFMRFLGLSLSDRAPDAKTIWAFSERLTQAGAIEGLFSRFDLALQEAGYIAMGGQFVDAMLVAAPKQRKSDGEKQGSNRARAPGRSGGQTNQSPPEGCECPWTVQFGKAKAKPGGTKPLDICHSHLRLKGPHDDLQGLEVHPALGRF